MTDVAVVACFGDSAQDRRIVQLLRVIKIVSARHTGCVVMQEVSVIVRNPADYVALLNLQPQRMNAV